MTDSPPPLAVDPWHADLAARLQDLAAAVATMSVRHLHLVDDAVAAVELVVHRHRTGRG